MSRHPAARDANPAVGKDGHSFVPHVFETWAGTPAGDPSTWCKWCNTTLTEVPGMHAGTPGLPSPAPWSIAPWGRTGSGIDDAKGHRIAGLRWSGGSVSMRVEFEEWLANGRLMVAAPELLAALDNLVGAGAVHEFDCDHAEHDADSGCIYCEARAAILRATGKVAN